MARGLLGEIVSTVKTMLKRPSDAIEALKRTYQPRWRRRLDWALSWLGRGLLTSAVVWLAALPLVALRFHLVSPIGVLLNIPLIPFTSLALLLGAGGMVVGAIWSPLASVPVHAADLLLRLSEQIVRWGASQPWGYVFVPGPTWVTVAVFYLLLLLATVASAACALEGLIPRWRFWRFLLWLAVPACTFPGWLLGSPARTGGTLEGDLLAIGHGLAVVLHLPDGRTLLYDCGRMGDPRVGRRIIAPALWSRGIARIDAIYLSHADQDHYNGIPDLLDRFQVGELVLPAGFVTETEENPGVTLLLDQFRARRIPIRTIAAPRQWTQATVHFTVLHPPRGWHPETPDNARSLVLDVEHLGHHLLLTGDLDQLGLVELVAQAQPEPIDLMLSPHHGGRSANPPWLYSWAKPRAVVVSQRMPAPGTSDALMPLERSGIPLLRTWQRGAVHFKWRSDQIITEGFLDHPHQTGPQLLPREK